MCVYIYIIIYIYISSKDRLSVGFHQISTASPAPFPPVFPAEEQQEFLRRFHLAQHHNGWFRQQRLIQPVIQEQPEVSWMMIFESVKFQCTMTWFDEKYGLASAKCMYHDMGGFMKIWPGKFVLGYWGAH